jgi:hypothetical protein
MHRSSWGIWALIAYAVACLNHQQPRIAFAVGALAVILTVAFFWSSKEQEEYVPQ